MWDEHIQVLDGNPHVVRRIGTDCVFGVVDPMPDFFGSSPSPAVAEIVVFVVGSFGWHSVQRLALFFCCTREDAVFDLAVDNFESFFVVASLVAERFEGGEE